MQVARAAKRQKVVAIPRALKGFVRTAGFYGRFNPRNARNNRPPEMKFFDTTLSFNVDTTLEVPATGQLALIPQGDTQSTRDGRAAYVKSIQIRASLRDVPAGASVSGHTVYMYLVQDTQCNGAAATVSGDTGIFSTALADTAMLNLANSDRFKILKKWIIDFNAGSGVGGAINTTSKHIEYYSKCNIPIQYDNAASTGAITTIRSNNLFLVAGSSVADDIVAVSGTCRLRFQD